MVRRGSGAVVNTASIGSERGLAGACAYNASKHAVVGLTRTAASEVAQKGVRVNCVMPGVIETPLLVEVVVFSSTFDCRGTVFGSTFVSSICLTISRSRSTWADTSTPEMCDRRSRMLVSYRP